MLIQSKENASLAHLSKISGLSTTYIEMIIRRLVEDGLINYRGRKSCYLTAKGKALVGNKNKKKQTSPSQITFNKGVKTLTRPLTDILKSIHMLTGKRTKQ
jgi:predicted transcriptional regulator